MEGDAPTLEGADSGVAITRLIDGAAGAPSPAVQLAGIALAVALVLIPLLACLFAALNLKRHPDRRVLFLTAILSSGITALAFLAVAVAPWLLPRSLEEMGILGFTLLFLYVWTLLDLWRGAQVAAFHPRWLAISIVIAGLAVPISITAMQVLP